jgi:hypothetical protein
MGLPLRGRRTAAGGQRKRAAAQQQKETVPVGRGENCTLALLLRCPGPLWVPLTALGATKKGAQSNPVLTAAVEPLHCPIGLGMIWCGEAHLNPQPMGFSVP